FEAAGPRRDRAGLLRGLLVAGEAGGLVSRAVGRGLRVRVVAGHAAQVAPTLEVAGRLHQPDRLVPDHRRVVDPDRAGRDHPWRPVALAAFLHLLARGESAG